MNLDRVEHDSATLCGVVAGVVNKGKFQHDGPFEANRLELCDEFGRFWMDESRGILGVITEVVYRDSKGAENEVPFSEYLALGKPESFNVTRTTKYEPVQRS